MRQASNTDGDDDDEDYDYDEDEDDEVFQPSSNPTLRAACIHTIKRLLFLYCILIGSEWLVM